MEDSQPPIAEAEASELSLDIIHIVIYTENLILDHLIPLHVAPACTGSTQRPEPSIYCLSWWRFFFCAQRVEETTLVAAAEGEEVDVATTAVAADKVLFDAAVVEVLLLLR